MKLPAALICFLCCTALLPAGASAAGAGTIAGVVVDAGTSAPIEGTRVCAVNQSTQEDACGETDASGNYTLAPVEAGDYTVTFTGLICVGDECAAEYFPQQASPVTVLEGQTTPVNTSLVAYGSIEGTVTESGTGTPIADLKIEVEGIDGQNGENGGEAITDGSGHYRVRGLNAGEYKVVFTGQVCASDPCVPTYAERYWEDVKPQNPATPVTVADGIRSNGINAELERNGAISGTVKDAQGNPIAKTFVCANSQTEYFPTCVITASGGQYELRNLPPGEFNVYFTGRICTEALCELEPCELALSCPHTYLSQFWPGVLTDEEATLLTVTANHTREEVNATLSPGGQIQGKVTVAALDQAPLAGFRVCGSAETTAAVGRCTTTDANGEYKLEGLGGSDWLVEFKEPCPDDVCPGTYETQFWQGKATAGEATLIGLTAPEVKTGVNASIKELTPHVPAFTADPVVTGVPVVSRMLSCTAGTWTGHPTAIRYAWLRDGAPIAGAEASAYRTVSADQDNDVTCEVTVSNSAGSKEALSNNVAIGPEIAPSFTTQPALSGTPTVGSTLSCTEGVAANYPISTEYAWLRDGTAIAGQGGSSYNVTSEDQGALLSCRVTMTNGAGSAHADSTGVAIPARQEEAKPSEETKPTGPTGAGSSSGSSPTTVTEAPLAAPKPGTASASGGKASAGRTVSITLKCSGQYACQGSLKLTVKQNGKTVTIGTASFNIAVGKSQAVAVKLNAKGEKLVAGAGKKGLKVQLSGTGVKSRTLQVS